MRQETSNRAIQTRGFGVFAAIAGAVALIAAAPARANNDFQNGFEDQLGRIAAFGAVNLGLQILTGGYYPAVVPVPVAPVVQARYYAPAHAPYYPAYYGPRKVVVKYPKAHRHDRYCQPRHGYYDHHYGYRDGGRRYNGYDEGRGHGGRGKQYRGGHGRSW